MKYIERYLYALGNYLPCDNKEDILKEVEANIHDMLAEDYSEGNVIEVLKQLGSPRKLSVEYHSKKRYLIGPMYFNSYLKTLSFVCLLAGTIIGIISLISFLMKNIESGITFSVLMEMIGVTIGSFIEGAFAGAIWVTIIYAIIEHSDFTFDGKKVIKKTEWCPTMLKEVPDKKRIQYKNHEILIEICFSTVFTILFISLAKYIGLYENGTLVATLFNLERFKVYIIIFVVMLIVYIFIDIKMYLSRYPNFKNAILKTFYNIANMIVGIVFITDKEIFNPNFRLEVIRLFEYDDSQYDQVFFWIKRTIIFFIIVGNVIDIIKVNSQAYKNQNKPKTAKN